LLNSSIDVQDGDNEVRISESACVISDVSSSGNSSGITHILERLDLPGIIGPCEGDQSRALQEIPQFKLCYKICYNSPPGDSSEN